MISAHSLQNIKESSFNGESPPRPPEKGDRLLFSFWGTLPGSSPFSRGGIQPQSLGHLVLPSRRPGSPSAEASPALPASIAHPRNSSGRRGTRRPLPSGYPKGIELPCHLRRTDKGLMAALLVKDLFPAVSPVESVMEQPVRQAPCYSWL